MSHDNNMPDLHQVDPVPSPATRNTLPFDAQTYWHYLDGLDISDEQRAALLETLWNIMSTFVDIAFGLDPVQQVIPALVQAAWDDEDQNRQHFNAAATDQNISKEGTHDE